MVQKRGQVSDGGGWGLAKFSPDGGDPSPPQEKTLGVSKPIFHNINFGFEVRHDLVMDKKLEIAYWGHLLRIILLQPEIKIKMALVRHLLPDGIRVGLRRS